MPDFFSIRCSLLPVSLRVQAGKQKSSLEISDRGGLIQGISYLSNWRAKMPNREGDEATPSLASTFSGLEGHKDSQDPRPPDWSWSLTGRVWPLLETQRRHTGHAAIAAMLSQLRRQKGTLRFLCSGPSISAQCFSVTKLSCKPESVEPGKCSFLKHKAEQGGVGSRLESSQAGDWHCTSFKFTPQKNQRVPQPKGT